MATITAAKGGNWSDPTVWNGGVLPGAGGANDNADSNGYSVTINQDVNLNGGALIGTSAGAGGFIVASSRTITANITASVKALLSVNCSAGVTVTVIGNVTAGTTGAGIFTGSAGALNITGNVLGGSGSNTHGVDNRSSGPMTVTGNVTGGASGNGIFHYKAGAILTVVGIVTGGSVPSPTGITNGLAGTVNITGSVVGAVYFGVDNQSTGLVALTGNTTGGSGNVGIWNSGAGTVTVSGSATGGTNSVQPGARNNAGGSMTVGTAVGNNFGPGGGSSSGPGVSGSATAGAVTNVYKVQYGPYGQSPTAGAVKMLSDATNMATFKDSAGGADIALVPARPGGSSGPFKGPMG